MIRHRSYKRLSYKHEPLLCDCGIQCEGVHIEYLLVGEMSKDGPLHGVSRYERKTDGQTDRNWLNRLVVAS